MPFNKITLLLLLLLTLLSSMASTRIVYDYSSIKLPKLIAFDLDGTIWYPDMYMLWGGGSPFTPSKNGRDLIDKKGENVQLLGITREILEHLHTNIAFANTKVAWVSCTDEPDWAEECLNKFTTSGGVPISKVAHNSQIFKANKQNHFRNLKEAYPEIEYSDMLFFDNEHGNIASVSKLGVNCVFASEGMTPKAWEQGLRIFDIKFASGQSEL